MNVRAAALLLLLAAPAGAARVLIVGDSHAVGPFGSAFEARLRDLGHSTALYAVCGASSSWWLGPKRPRLSSCFSMHGYGKKFVAQEGASDPPAPALDDLLAAQPGLVVFALGSNADGSAADTAAAAGRLIAKLAPGTRCVWIGPPPMPKRRAAIDALYKELPKALAAGATPCSLVDSRTMIMPSDAAPNDHFYGPAAVAWGRAAAESIPP